MGKEKEELFNLDSIFSESTNDDVNTGDDIMKLNLFGEGTNMGVVETPSGKPYDAEAISVPKTEVITVDAYNSALVSLKKSFKEGAEIMEMLEKVKVVPNKTPDDEQKTFTENAIYEAMVDSYYDGPIYESVQKENKAEIKALAKKVRKQLCKFTRRIKWYFKKINTGVRLGLLDPFILSKFSNDLKLYSWQMVCLIYMARGTAVKESIKSLNDEFAEILGDKYELKVVKIKMGWVTGNVADLTDEEKEKTRSIWHYYMVIVNEKGDDTPNEVEIKINKDDLSKLLQAQAAAGEEKK